MKIYDIARVSSQLLLDPAGQIAQCEEALCRQIEETAARVARAPQTSPVLLLSGPSGAGKTTAAPTSFSYRIRRPFRTYSNP